MMATDTRRDDIRARALQDLRRFEVVMEGHFDYGNGYHGRLYLNPHQLFRYPSTIWRVAQDLIDVLPPGVADTVTVVAGPATGGALYGTASHGWMASFKRPGARSQLPGLYLAGGSAHPGPGVPMAALSGGHAAASVLHDLAATRAQRMARAA